MIQAGDSPSAEETEEEKKKREEEEAKIKVIVADLKKKFVQGDSTGEPNSHGVQLPRVGTGIKVLNSKIDPKIAAAAVNQFQAVIVIDGASFLAPMEAIDPGSVELACN